MTKRRLLAFFFLSGCMPIAADSTGTSSNIIGGINDTGDPAVVMLQQLDGDMEMCTGTIVAPTIVFTAAHCLDPASHYSLLVGPGGKSQTTVPVTEVHVDPAFTGNVVAGHDVAVAILGQPSTIAPIPVDRDPLPSGLNGQQLRVVGYGDADTQGNGYGTKRAASLFIDDVTPTEISIGGVDHVSCSGDSGGPGLFRINGAEMLVGMTSYGTDADCSNGHVYYSRIDANLAFLTPFLDGTATVGSGSTPAPATDDGSNPTKGTSGCDPKTDPTCS